MFPISSLKAAAFLTFLVVFMAAEAQQRDTLNRVKYTPEFKFKEGVFTNFDQVRQNNPIPKSRIISAVPYDDPDFFERVLKEKRLQLYDNLGVKQEIQTKAIWGFSRNGILYIYLNNSYFRITIIGNICHFVGSLTSYNRNSGVPYYGYGYPYYYSPYYNPSYSPYSNNASVEMKQYLLDFLTGNVLDYSEESVRVLLMSDPELHDEYAGLNKKKQKQLKFLYIRKFNERNPLYFPEI